MLEKEIRFLHRDNYASLVKENEKDLVHYKVENVLHDPKTNRRISQQTLCMTPPVQFDSVKKNLELQGNTIEILYHPLGRYTETVIPLPLELQAELREKELEEKNAEIEKLREELKSAKESAKKESAKDSSKKEVKKK